MGHSDMQFVAVASDLVRNCDVWSVLRIAVSVPLALEESAY